MATFRNLPAEIRLMIWEAMLHLCPIMWHVDAVALGEPQCTSEHYKRRVGCITTLARLTRESHHYVRYRFWFAQGPWCFGAPVDFKIDLFYMNWPLNWIPFLHERRIRYEGSTNTGLYEVLGAKVENVYVCLERLNRFADALASGFIRLPGLKRIYAKSQVVCMKRVSLSSSSIPTIPAASIRDEAGSVQAIVDGFCYLCNDQPAANRAAYDLEYVRETDGFDRLDHTTPTTWDARRFLHWPTIERLGIVCVFVYGESSIDRESRITDRFYVFSSTRGPGTRPRQIFQKGDDFLNMAWMTKPERANLMRHFPYD
ncbi:hypothetical protein F5B18DRAFT_120756 [Nemania serpens]|nr:hypothetical protein F5B18DRAFT_120756 [Nemania serpens]